jgi:hypothetical protein
VQKVNTAGLSAKELDRGVKIELSQGVNFGVTFRLNPKKIFMKSPQNTQTFMAGMNAERGYRGCNPLHCCLRCPAF